MEEKIVKQINFYIAQAVKEYNANNCRRDESYKMNLAKIHGMVEALAMMTDKLYVVTEEGLKEEQR